MVVLPEAPLSRSQCDVVAFSVRRCRVLSATLSPSQRDTVAFSARQTGYFITTTFRAGLSPTFTI